MRLSSSLDERNSDRSATVARISTPGCGEALQARHPVPGGRSTGFVPDQANDVRLRSFGNFELREKKERPGRNPKTGDEIPITARRVACCIVADKVL